MKKSLTLFLSLVLLLQFTIGVTAYTFDDNSLYTIDIPEDFNRIGENEFLSENGATFSVAFTDNTEEKFCLADLNDSEITEYAEKIAKESAEAFKSLGLEGSMSVVSAEKIKHSSGKTAIVVVFKTSVNNENGQTTRLQKMYEFTGVENKFTFTYTPKEEIQINDFDTAFDSIEIHEEQIQSIGDKITTAALFGGVVILICIGIFRFIKSPVKRKK